MEFWRKPLDYDQQVVPRGEVHILKERCKGCGFCVEYCPDKVLEISKDFNKKGYHPPQPVAGRDCVLCRLCELLCPDFAIFVTEKRREVEHV